ncbi:hypothetical protein B5G50_26865 [Brevibacillus brevis]|nr:hypothetical protein B5G50_26865 [Brevibacillus brevis]
MIAAKPKKLVILSYLAMVFTCVCGMVYLFAKPCLLHAIRRVKDVYGSLLLSVMIGLVLNIYRRKDIQPLTKAS